ERLFADNTIFAGVTYTDDHVILTGMLVVAAALVLGAVIVIATAVRKPSNVLWLGAALVPAAVCYVGVGVVAWYVSNFLVKPNQLVREGPYIANNIAMTRSAFALDRIEQHPFPAETTIEAVEADRNQATLQNIR